MTREEIIATIRKNAAAIKAKRDQACLFGSRVRGDNRPDSDIDGLGVEPDASFSLLNLIGVEHIIEDATGLQAQATCGDPSTSLRGANRRRYRRSILTCDQLSRQDRAYRYGDR